MCNSWVFLATTKHSQAISGNDRIQQPHPQFSGDLTNVSLSNAAAFEQVFHNVVLQVRTDLGNSFLAGAHVLLTLRSSPRVPPGVIKRDKGLVGSRDNFLRAGRDARISLSGVVTSTSLRFPSRLARSLTRSPHLAFLDFKVSLAQMVDGCKKKRAREEVPNDTMTSGCACFACVRGQGRIETESMHFSYNTKCVLSVFWLSAEQSIILRVVVIVIFLALAYLF